MFRKFEMSTTMLQYSMYRSQNIVDVINAQPESKVPLNGDELHAADTWFGCKNVELWKQERCPYYRVYPGVMESLLKLNLNKLLDVELEPFPFGLRTLSIEIPKDYWEELGCTSVILVDYEQYYGVTHQGLNKDYGFNLINLNTLKDDIKRYNKLTNSFTKLIFGVLAIGDNPDIVKPVVLRADEKKYQLTGDEKYVEKARRRGVIGFDIGEGIPTKAQIKKMIEENEIALEQGRKAPHIRCAHLHLYHTGKGRTIPKIMLIDSLVVNWDLLTKIPQGFYEGE